MSLQNKMGIKVKLFCVFVQYRLVSELFSMSPKWNSAVGRSRKKFCYLQIERHISFLSQTVFVRIFKLIMMNILFSIVEKYTMGGFEGSGLVNGCGGDCGNSGSGPSFSSIRLV